MPWGQGEEDSHTDTHPLFCPFTLISTDLQVQVCTPEQLYIPICTNVVTCIFYFILTCTSHRHLLHKLYVLHVCSPLPTQTLSPLPCVYPLTCQQTAEKIQKVSLKLTFAPRPRMWSARQAHSSRLSSLFPMRRAASLAIMPCPSFMNLLTQEPRASPYSL